MKRKVRKVLFMAGMIFVLLLSACKGEETSDRESGKREKKSKEENVDESSKNPIMDFGSFVNGKKEKETGAETGEKTDASEAAADENPDAESRKTVLVKEVEYWYEDDGSIAERVYREYEYDKAGNMTKKIPYYVGDDDYRWWEYEHDSAGNMTKDVAHDFDGNITSWREYEYDSAGNMTKTIHYKPDGNISSREEYEYDSMGNRTKDILYDADGGVVGQTECKYEYDGAGNLTKRSTNGYRDEYEYDSAGNMTKYINYYQDGILEWNEYEYDNAGNMTKQISYDGEGTILAWDEYEYDSVEKLTKHINYISYMQYRKFNNTDYYQEAEITGQDEYEYDSEGNMISHIGYEVSYCYDNDIIAKIVADHNVYEYGSTGDRTKHQNFYFAGNGIMVESVIQEDTYEYDSAGNKIKDIAIGYYEGDGIKDWHGHEYDSEGNMTKDIYYNTDGSVSSWTEYEYMTIMPK